MKRIPIRPDDSTQLINTSPAYVGHHTQQRLGGRLSALRNLTSTRHLYHHASVLSGVSQVHDFGADSEVKPEVRSIRSRRRR